MSVQSHLSELEKRHHAIDRELEAARRQPGTPDVVLTELKRKKLQLKDEIERLRGKLNGSGAVH
ncbi:YdcH family protein [Camelimonas abortus]|uniref:YdcH family protein n=1 Tax=Camelimonas abortus TaxID=1017184 RepID=A0ABV7LEF8_9HYPH